MTCREKLEIEYPKYVNKKFNGGCCLCPMHFGYAKRPQYCKDDNNFEYCKDCWDREVEENEMKNDNVNHPSHYTQGGIECYKAIEASMAPEAYKGYLKGNVLKYVWRYEKKGSEVENLRKAEWYLKELIKEVESHE